MWFKAAPNKFWPGHTKIPDLETKDPLCNVDNCSTHISSVLPKGRNYVNFKGHKNEWEKSALTVLSHPVRKQPKMGNNDVSASQAVMKVQEDLDTERRINGKTAVCAD